MSWKPCIRPGLPDLISQKVFHFERPSSSLISIPTFSDGFFVPHGYLSDDEGDEDCGMTDEAKKKRLEQRKKQVGVDYLLYYLFNPLSS